MRCNGRHHTSLTGTLSDCICLSNNSGAALGELIKANLDAKAYKPASYANRYGFHRRGYQNK